MVIPVWCVSAVVFAITVAVVATVMAVWQRRRAGLPGLPMQIEQQSDGTWERVDRD